MSAPADSFDSPDGRTCSGPAVVRVRKRPVVVEAVQLVDDDACDWDEIARWCGGRIYNIETSPGAEPRTLIDIRTLEGTMTAGEGWWIACGVKGEFHPVRADIFAETYEPAGTAAGGKAAYETWRAAVPDVACNVPGGPWEDLPVTVQAGFEAVAAGQPAPPAGEPLTHFFHCWRFPDHHACAVALIERQGEEGDRLIVRAAAAERELAEARRGTVAAQPSPGPVPGKAVRCPAGRVIRRVDYTQPQHPRRIHQDGTPCDHPGSISIGEPDPAPGWTAGGLEDALLANVDALSGLVRDMLQAFPDTADEQDWRDRAGQLHVCDPDGQPYRAYTEEDM